MMPAPFTTSDLEGLVGPVVVNTVTTLHVRRPVGMYYLALRMLGDAWAAGDFKRFAICSWGAVGFYAPVGEEATRQAVLS